MIPKKTFTSPLLHEGFSFICKMKYTAFFGLLFLILQGCSHKATVMDRDSHNTDKSTVYSAIFYIHADSDYLFHDADGIARQADEKALESTLKIAEEATRGEVFIIHQKPRRSFLWLIPRRNNDLYYFRNGSLQQQMKYRYDDASQSFLEKEAELYRHLSSASHNSKQQRYFFYFGHEIPAANGTGYHRSRPDTDVSFSTLTSGLEMFLDGEDDRFNLITLSTCSNGSPLIASHLLPVTNYLLTSPQNLHLSYMDVEGLLMLEDNPTAAPVEIARKIAMQSFQRLSDEVRTEVTLSVYDMSELRYYLDDLTEIVNEHEKLNQPNMYRDNRDCAEIERFDLNAFIRGVET